MMDAMGLGWKRARISVNLCNKLHLIYDNLMTIRPVAGGCSNDVDPDENSEVFGRGEVFCAR